ncbi:hypothetical protein LQ953_10420 [Sphingomonas sp. IC-56]|uniref:hypothetical protein n=1 Tax=Sphingomonas sp. IC-56 TaxID=2898529 RepID=UPI001E4973BB|nr:hypothetical protein [Sphingomonas sp. IC-56]MCD2324427.1 hypothetical protein [Sphingomonas sp. IC-56]
MKTAGLRALYLTASALITASVPGSAMASGEDVVMEQITPVGAAFSTRLDLPRASISLDVGQVATRYNSFGLVSAFADTVSLQVDHIALASGYVSHRIDNLSNVAQVVQMAQVPAAASDSGAPIELALFGSQLNLGGFTGVYGVADNVAEQVQSGTANFVRAMQFGTRNAARQVQDGSQLASAIIQAGQNNRAETLQTGLLNQAAILQSGRDNLAAIDQRGSNGFAVVSQTGVGNVALVRQ